MLLVHCTNGTDGDDDGGGNSGFETDGDNTDDGGDDELGKRKFHR